MLKSHQGPLTLDSILGKREREREWQLSLSSSYSLFAGLSQQRASSGRVREKCSKRRILKAKLSRPRGRLGDMIKPSAGEREVNATTSSLACSSSDYCCDERMCKLQPLFLWSSPAAGFFQPHGLRNTLVDVVVSAGRDAHLSWFARALGSLASAGFLLSRSNTWTSARATDFTEICLACFYGGGGGGGN